MSICCVILFGACNQSSGAGAMEFSPNIHCRTNKLKQCSGIELIVEGSTRTETGSEEPGSIKQGYEPTTDKAAEKGETES